ncbi:YhgE/Pip N-terminal domain protein [Coriobacterium glomerans PW2]|uniref:YhgE/Pip N-terminal domain protein n=1 Tax=Coriobacterium glomerans (strain ATCC 49209 / DSM 20642 / JCM 10262 / PW2) TaxID=700015 RepID=F2NB09_CORGP|nr:YhgE/Pip domain-containing protein [Coriobacterium glomerans]AEB07687.1 YhgE/Pip N-terminal domain protein [Coriobacterium glomerans PW2]
MYCDERIGVIGWFVVSCVIKIFRRDLMRLLRNPVALVLIAGVCVIPSLYAWYNIVANWDPYGNTANVHVAVANEDVEASSDYVGGLNAGEQTISRLKENHQLGWVFTSAAQAKAGVESGEYYAAVIIPKDFSKNLLSMFTDEYTQPKLTYYVNEKNNAIAPKVTDTGAETIEEQINDTFVATVSKTIMERAKEAGADVVEKGATAQSGLIGTIREANDALDQGRASLDGMTGTIDATKRAIASADTSLKSLSDRAPGLSAALAQGNDLLTTTRTSTRAFTTSLSGALSSGSMQLGRASSRASVGIGSASGAIISVQGKVDGMLADVQALIDDNQRAIDVLKQITDKTVDTSAIIGALQNENDRLQTVKDGLKTQSDDIKNSATSIAAASSEMNTAVQNGVSGVANVQSRFSSSVLPQLDRGLDSFSSVSGDLSGALGGMVPLIEQARGMLGELSGTLDQAKETIAHGDSAIGSVQNMLKRTRDDVAALRSSEVVGRLADLLDAKPEDLADFMSSPVSLVTNTVYPVATYGSGVAPFYTNLALWVGGFVLIAILKLEVDREGLPAFSPTQGYFGRWLLFVLLGVVQALIVCSGDLVLGMQCSSPALFLVAGVAISFVYVNIIFALASAFKHIGKAIAVILVIVQIPGSSGTYPIEMMPAFFQWLHPLLPFTYGINALRETVGGLYGSHYLSDLASLFAFLVAALVVGVGLRPWLLNMNLLFDRELSRTGVMISEKNSRSREHYSLRQALRVMFDTAAYRERVIVRADRFERRYPRLIRAGFLLVFGLPTVLFVLTAVLDVSIDGKIGMLVLWVVSIIVADAYMIAVEYAHESMRLQLRISALSDEGLRAQIRGHMDDSPLAARAAGILGGRDRSAATDDDIQAGKATRENSGSSSRAFDKGKDETL